jgi:hypothetical protein
MASGNIIEEHTAFKRRIASTSLLASLSADIVTSSFLLTLYVVALLFTLSGKIQATGE